MPLLGTFDLLVPTAYSKSLFHTASVACVPADMTFLVTSTGKVSPADQFPDYGTEALTQRAFAGYFTGLCAGNGQSSSNSTSRLATLAINVVITDYTVESNTFEIGDGLAPKYDTGNLSKQTLVKVTDPTRAIAFVTRRYASATTEVEAQFVSTRLLGILTDAEARTFLAAPAASTSSETGASAQLLGGGGFPATSGTGTAGGAGVFGGGTGGVATTGTAGAGGAVTVGGAAGGTATTGTAGAGGATTTVAGAGGAASGAAGTGGAGGAWTGGGGVGGAATDTAATAAGVGGAATLRSGAGGASSTTAVAGGAGGALAVTGGAGGAGAATGTGGAGAALAITGGAGGATSGAGTGGAGGAVTIQGGAGGTTSGGTAGAKGVVNVVGLVNSVGPTAVAVTGATTLTLADSGGIFNVDQDAAFDIDLPSPTVGPGLRFLFFVGDAGASNVTITVAGSAATFLGTIVNDITSVLPCTGSTITFASGVSALGDWVEVISVSTTLYYVRAVTSANGGITIA